MSYDWCAIQKKFSRKVKEKHESDCREGKGQIVELEKPSTIGHGKEAGKLISASKDSDSIPPSGRDYQGAMSLGTLKKLLSPPQFGRISFSRSLFKYYPCRSSHR